jgi:GDP-mannose pyrophosphatase NudK
MPKSITILSETVLANDWSRLSKIKYQQELPDGSLHVADREVYNRGNGAVILLYNLQKKTVVLTSQLRIATWFNGNKEGMMIEACAGVLDEVDPEDCIRRETEEELGYTVKEVKKVMEAYMSPGSVTEILYFFIGQYDETMRTGEGGGLDAEHENIEVLEMPFNDALNMISGGEIKDAKTIMLLQYLRMHGIM